MITMTINSSNDTMGDTSDRDCNRYREWLLVQFKSRFPGVNIDMTSNEGPNIEISLDEEDEDFDPRVEAELFYVECWEKCGWERCL